MFYLRENLMEKAMPNRREENGRDGCFYSDIAHQRLMKIHESTVKTEKNVDAIINSLDSKVEKLVDHLVNRTDNNVVPVSVLKTIIIFIVLFNFALVFGLPATEQLAKKVIGHYFEPAKAEVVR